MAPTGTHGMQMPEILCLVSLTILFKCSDIHPWLGRKTGNNPPSHSPGSMSHVATQQITFDIHQDQARPHPRHPLHCFTVTFQLMEDNVPMPSLDAVSISKPFYKSWTSQAEVNHHLDLAFDLIIFVAESIPFANSASQAPEISAVQHLASECVPWPVISNGCQSESQQQSEALGAVFWKSSILQGKSIFKANVEMLSPPVWCHAGL